ncbi:GTPase HflX [Ferrovum sp.]|uniref:GTPase HflX n=1 Tax=Ferrovum sp. TaxID=2609467 RepID=UPI0026279E75|nr:GTPase HflX [Ferrovum sp.]
MTDLGPLLGRGRASARTKAGPGGLERVAGEASANADRALLVRLVLGRGPAESSLDELQRLAQSAGLTVVGWMEGRRERPDPATFLGSGKVEEVAARVQAEAIGLVIVDDELSPVQERNLEQRLGCRVIDRTSLILDIFAQRARSHTGQLQVELAQLKRLSTRLVRGWTHLERQKGGIGLRGPGETQLETDRRLLAVRVKMLQARLVKVRRTVQLQRRARQRAGVLNVSLVGYTNAGKSTLFNRLTQGDSYVADQLFATLDTLTRRVYLAPGLQVTLSDTVGFVRRLPHTLVDAFRATLEETREADLLVLVVDHADPERAAQIEAVNLVLAEIGADQVPQLRVYNKVDLLTQEGGRIERDACGTISAVWASALTGLGMNEIRQAFLERCQSPGRPGELPVLQEIQDIHGT